MKKEWGFLFILFLFLMTTPIFVSGQASTALTDTTDKLATGVDKATLKWDYLGAEWKTILLKNSIVSKIDGFFKVISPVFTILFAMPYEMSLVLLCIIILWLIFWNVFHNILKSSGIIEKKASLIISLLLVVGLAQLGFFSSAVIFVGRFAFSPESKWARIILVIVIFFIVFLFQRLSQVFSKYIKARREANEKDLEKLNRTILGKLVNNIMEFSK